MKKLVIGVNHSYPESTGGSEKVVQQIAEGLSSQFGYECFIFSNTAKQERIINGVVIKKCSMVLSDFLNQLNKIKPDHFFIYGDLFYQWPLILSNTKKLLFSKSIALVGMNNMLSNNFLFSQFKKTINDFSVITHSDNYQDFIECKNNSIPVSVIPNGINLDEFNIVNNNFRKKYNVTDKNIILCVSNFFPGKGQEFLAPIFERLYKKRKDFIVIFISSNCSWNIVESRRKNITNKINLLQFNSLFLNNIPREDVISAFLSSDVFVFPSQKEVSPLVILESMASRTPWISLPVGNVNKLKGGFIIDSNKKDIDGLMLYSDDVYQLFCDGIDRLLSDDKLKKILSYEGRKQIEEEYDFREIIKMYDKFFSESIDRFSF
jgi:glycosyltransferase involved in cell wall biosynthesis